MSSSPEIRMAKACAVKEALSFLFERISTKISAIDPANPETILAPAPMPILKIINAAVAKESRKAKMKKSIEAKGPVSGLLLSLFIIIEVLHFHNFQKDNCLHLLYLFDF